MRINGILKLALTSLLLLLSFPACGAEEKPEHTNDFNLWVNPGLLSYHFDRNAGYRELNWGFGVQSDWSEHVSVLAGNFINSDRVRSKYAGVVWQPLSWHALKLGVAAGAFDGYPSMRNGGWFAAALPWISIRNERVGLNFTIVPNYANRLHGALSGQIIFRVR